MWTESARFTAVKRGGGACFECSQSVPVPRFAQASQALPGRATHFTRLALQEWQERWGFGFGKDTGGETPRGPREERGE